MGAAAIILLTAGFTAYTLVNTTLGVILWVAALMVALAAVVLWFLERRRRRPRPGSRSRAK